MADQRRRRGEAGRGESGGMAFLGKGQPAPSHQLGGLRECCKLPQRGPSGARADEGFSCILSRQIAFPSISVLVAYSLHGYVLGLSRGILHTNIRNINS